MPQTLDPQALSQDVRRSGFQELGSTGLRHWGGVVYDEFLPELQLDRGRKIYRAMASNDPVIGASLLAIINLIRKITWYFKPASESQTEDQQARDFYHQVFFDDLDQPFKEVISEILTMLPFGWSLLEETYKYRQGDSGDPRRRSRYNDGLVGLRKLAPRDQMSLDRWEFGPHGETIGMWQNAPPDHKRVYIPMAKALHFTTVSRKRNPEGSSILRNCYTSYFKKSRLENIEGIGVERGLAGIPVIKAPLELFLADASDGDRAVFETLKKIATNIHRDEQEGLVFPLVYDEAGNELYKIELLTTAGKDKFDTSGIITRYDGRMAMSMLTDFLLLGHERIGSYSLSVDKTDMFVTGIETYPDHIADVINRRALPRLKRMNPTITGNATLMHNGIDPADVKSLVESICKMAVVPGFEGVANERVMAWILSLMKAPVPSDEDPNVTSNRPGAQDPGETVDD